MPALQSDLPMFRIRKLWTLLWILNNRTIFTTIVPFIWIIYLLSSSLYLLWSYAWKAAEGITETKLAVVRAIFISLAAFIIIVILLGEQGSKPIRKLLSTIERDNIAWIPPYRNPWPLHAVLSYNMLYFPLYGSCDDLYIVIKLKLNRHCHHYIFVCEHLGDIFPCKPIPDIFVHRPSQLPSQHSHFCERKLKI